MKKPYLEPELEVIHFLTEDILAAIPRAERGTTSEPGSGYVDGEVELPAV